MTLANDSVKCDRRMLLLYPLIFLPLLTATETVQPAVMQRGWKLQLENTRSSAEWISEGILSVVDSVLPVSQSSVEGKWS